MQIHTRKLQGSNSSRFSMRAHKIIFIKINASPKMINAVSAATITFILYSPAWWIQRRRERIWILTLEARATAAVAMQSAHSALCFDWQTFNIKSQLRHIHIDSGAVNGSLVDLTLRGIARTENFSFWQKRERPRRAFSQRTEKERFFLGGRVD